MFVSREKLQRDLKNFERDMRVIAGTYVTTERFLKDFLRRAKEISRSVSAEDREWVSEKIGHILGKFGFKAIEDDDPLS